jgi:hypothetical protein
MSSKPGFGKGKLLSKLFFDLIRLFGVALLVTACAAQPLVPSLRSSNGAPTTIKLEPYVGRLVTLQVRIGNQSYPFLLDTGGGWTSATPKVAKAGGCVPFGRLVGSRMSGEQISSQKCGRTKLFLEGVALEGDLGVFDLMALLPNELPELGGTFALSSLRDRPFTLDLESKQLILETRSSLARRTKGLMHRRIKLQHEAAGYGTTVFVEVAARPEPLWFLLDSGNLDAVIVDPHSLPQLDVSPGTMAAASGKEPFDLDLVVAGQSVSGVRSRVRDIIYDGALSEAVMRKFVITVDISNETIWFARRPSPAGKGN